MDPIRVIECREDILADNAAEAKAIRDLLGRKRLFMLNLMSSPGAGKTSLILATLRALKGSFRFGVVEADIASTVDAEKIVREGVPALQLQTGGFCHLDAVMVKSALDGMDLEALDCIIIENVGNLVCPAEFDTGANRSAMILSVPEGDDKPLKYPLMFTVCSALVVNKTDYLEGSDFDMEVLEERVRRLNPDIRIFPVSCRTGEGLAEWCRWLEDGIAAAQAPV